MSPVFVELGRSLGAIYQRPGDAGRVVVGIYSQDNGRQYGRVVLSFDEADALASTLASALAEMRDAAATASEGEGT